VSAINHAFPVRNFLHVINEDCALALQVFDNILVMNDFLANVDWRPKGLKGDAHDIDGAHYAGTESTGLQKQQSFSFGRLCHSIVINCSTRLKGTPGHKSLVVVYRPARFPTNTSQRNAVTVIQ